MFDKLKQLGEMKKQVAQIQRELDSTDVNCSDIRGIKIVVSGSQNMKSIEVDNSYFTLVNKEKLELDLVRSLNIAIKKSQEVAANRMKSMLPPGFPGF